MNMVWEAIFKSPSFKPIDTRHERREQPREYRYFQGRRR
jgi:hypothetical protein